MTTSSPPEPVNKDTWYAPAGRSSDQEIDAQTRLFSHNPLFSTLYDAVPDIVMVLNQHRQIVFANTTLLSVLGLERETFRGGQRLGEALDCSHAYDQEYDGCGTTEFCTTCGAVQAIVGGLAGRIAANECRIIRADGDPLDLYVWATPLKEADQLYTVVVIKDISHEKRRQALEKIFFHDILNIVNNILISAELLKESDPPIAEDMLKANLFELAGHLAEEIVAQRELAQAENNELVVHPASISARAVLQSTLLMAGNYELAEGKTLTIAPDAQDITFISDKVLLTRILGNMVKNALEASSAGDTITLDCRKSGKSVVFTVHDPVFMPRKVQLQIFQRSFSTKGSGRGLGTFSIKLLTERYLGGKVTFKSSQAEGTMFRAVYPLTLEAS